MMIYYLGVGQMKWSGGQRVVIANLNLQRSRRSADGGSLLIVGKLEAGMYSKSNGLVDTARSTVYVVCPRARQPRAASTMSLPQRHVTYSVVKPGELLDVRYTCPVQHSRGRRPLPRSSF